MEGRFEDYTLGRNITMERVKEIYKLSLKHEFKLAGLRSFENYITEKDIMQKRALADRYRADPEGFERMRAEAGEKLKAIPVMAKGVGAASNASGASVPPWALVAAGAAGLALAGALLARRAAGDR
jgi:hypothetical protein